MGIHLNIGIEGLTYAVIALALITLVLLILVVYNYKRTTTILKNYRVFNMRNEEGRKLIEILNSYMDTTTKIASKFGTLGSRVSMLEEQIASCFQKIGIVRYNPFPGSGGELSFSMAFLDQSDSGYVMTGIFNRESCFTYIKPIEKGQATKYKLSEEEENALKIAVNYMPATRASADVDQ